MAGARPFMTFYTPTYKRPTYLKICRDSVQMQTCKDYQHMVIVDDAGIGIDGMFADIRRHADQIRGEYVFILADDDKLLEPQGLEWVKNYAHEWDNPPVIIVKNYKWGDVFPKVWDEEPQLAMIDTGNFIIRSDVFRRNADKFGLRYEGDFDFIHCLWEQGYPFYWCDYIFSGMQVGGKGRTEVEIMQMDQKRVRVRAVKSFAARIGEQAFRVRRGQEMDLPPGADWIRAGLCVIVEDVEPEPIIVETADLPPVERAVSPRGKKGRGK